MVLAPFRTVKQREWTSSTHSLLLPNYLGFRWERSAYISYCISQNPNDFTSVNSGIKLTFDGEVHLRKVHGVSWWRKLQQLPGYEKLECRCCVAEKE